MADNLSEFFGQDTQLLESIRAIATLVTYKPGALVFGEGDDSDWVAVIQSGRARALRYSIAGTEVVVSTFEPGSLFGEMAALAECERTTDIYALNDLTLAQIPKTAFIRLLESHPTLALKLCRVLAARVERTTHRLFEEVALTSRHKVYAWLLRENQRTAERSDGIGVIGGMPAISDLARELNLARETVSRTISRLREDGVVSTNGTDLAILKPHHLVELLEA